MKPLLSMPQENNGLSRASSITSIQSVLDQTQTSKLSELSHTNEKLFSELHQFRDKYLEVKS